MKKSTFDNIKTVVLVALTVTITGVIDALPWWSFIVPVILLGVFIKRSGWQTACITTGFLSGFIVWAGINLFVDKTSKGVLLNKLGQLIMMPEAIVILLAGILGGLLTSLALYTGWCFLAEKESDLVL
jgi:hypothetical protein